MTHMTIKDIARQSGVSIATVSRVINRNPRVNKEIANRVNEVIKQTGYIPNQIARSLKTANTRSVGFVVADMRSDYFSQISTSIDSVLRNAGYSLIVCTAINDSKSEYDYLRLLLEKQVDGIIINTTGFNDDFITEISHKLPVVLMHRKISNLSFKGDWIDTDIFFSAYELTKVLIHNGHRRIGVLSGPLYLSTGWMRYEGYAKAMNEIGCDIGPGHPLFFEAPFTIEAGIEGAKYFAQLEDPPTAIIFMHSETTIGAMRYYRSHNIKLPAELSFVSVGNIANSDLMYINPYQYAMQPQSVGTRTATLILERIEAENMLPNREIFLNMPIIPGNSVIPRE